MTQNSHSPAVLIVEDDKNQLELLESSIKMHGFTPICAMCGEEAMELVQEAAPDVVVLDWMLPGISGLEVCRRIRANKLTRTIPVIMLSARTIEEDRISGLKSGADDYVTKPFSIEELMERVRACLRRTMPTAVGEIIECCDIKLDAEKYRVYRGGNQLHLGSTEYRLLATLMEKPGRVLTRDQLLVRVWGRRIFVETRTVDVHIARLRKSLCKFGGVDPIRTVRGVGYSIG
ncbi:MAG: phosphate regulon transcriptional regulator PhoB [Albidovulum sp.]|nr:phosphate regulon transcriptional regulator PhoB [Albidovulum sp.]